MEELHRFTFKWMQEETLYTAEMSLYKDEPIYIVMWNRHGSPQAVVYSIGQAFENIKEGRWTQITVEK
ncbi:hypothetical protein Kirov_137 [Bacillus phage Kirov]|uniref:Uncharacterized protein n=1 Tax=Bacillus phage Kirov TaxID=2783539 RepID=A0A7U3RYB4_9CAUD|nr:hypothetical protein PQE67_gp167 [Bacillus phage Kirov]QOV08336.1 hypothetical protein Kirov_137 [Bacillus phage Kirov]